MKILGISGRKQAGKNTMFNLILGIEMLTLGIVRNKVELNSNGKLIISDVFGDNAFAGIFDVDRNNDTMREFLGEYVYPYIKNYSYADILKKDVCINILGLTYEQCFGTDEQKNQLTHLRWEDMPGIITEEDLKGSLHDDLLGLILHAPGQMTAREVMQYVGTDIFRKMYNPVWSKACLRRILAEQSEFAIVTDVRFPNEVEAIKENGGRVIRLTRDIYGDKAHESERALDRDVYDWTNFDAVIDNHNMTIGQQNEAMLKILRDWEWLVAEEEGVS